MAAPAYAAEGRYGEVARRRSRNAFASVGGQMVSF
jgi:hypothetical protein